jgi:FkbM family methyltransferase
MRSDPLMDRAKRDKLIQRVFWSPLGMHAVRAGSAFARRWSSVVLNRSVRATSNGEMWVPQLLPAAPLLIDVGFHRGEFAHEVLSARPQGRVIGFEPATSMRELYATLHGPDPRIQLETVALSDRAGQFEFNDDASGNNSLAPIEFTERTVRYVVETTTLDAYAATHAIEHIDLLKIDVEGYDLHVLEGARELLLRQAIDMFYFEYNATWVLTRRYLRDASDFFADKDYELFRLYNGFLSPFSYSFAAERFDLPAMFVGVSKRRLERGDIPLRSFPG